MELFEPQPEESLSSLVRQVAANRAVSERTVWRWIATMRREGRTLAFERCCEHCGEPLPPQATIRRSYCEARCRAAAQYRRQGARPPSADASAAESVASTTEG